MIPVFNRLLWVHKSDIKDFASLVSELTVKPEKYLGVSEPIQLFEIAGDYVGVPRRWGLLHFRNEVRDNTVLHTIIWPKYTIDWRKGQYESVAAIATYLLGDDLIRRGALLEAHPGFGKTVCGLAIAASLGLPALILVHKGDLADQWHESGRKFFPGCESGHCQQDHWDYEGKHFVTAMMQTIYSRRDEIPANFWQQFGILIVDEVHHCPAQTFETVLRLSPIRYRLGVSATFRRGDGLDFIWNWHIGKIEHKAYGERLVGEYVQVEWKSRIKDEWFKWGKKIIVSRLITAISKNVPYNCWLAEQIKRAGRVDRKVLVISDRIEQLQFIKDKLSAIDCTVGMYIGSKNGKRTTKRDLEYAKSCNIILATYGMIGEGTDIPELDTLFFATPRGDIQQHIGRIQRICEGKKKLLVIDPVFTTPFCWGLARKREKMYERLKFVKQETK